MYGVRASNLQHFPQHKQNGTIREINDDEETKERRMWQIKYVWILAQKQLERSHDICRNLRVNRSIQF